MCVRCNSYFYVYVFVPWGARLQAQPFVQPMFLTKIDNNNNNNNNFLLDTTGVMKSGEKVTPTNRPFPLRRWNLRKVLITRDVTTGCYFTQ